MEELKVNVTGLVGSELTIKTGKADDTIHPIPNVFTGILCAPGAFMENRKTLLDKTNCRLEIDSNKGELVFYSDEKSKFRDAITGKLEKSKILALFGINQEKKYSDKGLAKFLRTTAFYFPNQDALKELIDKLMKFDAMVNLAIVNDKDLKGNAKVAFEKTVTSKIPDSIIVKLPIFEGYEEKEFRLDIGAEATSSSIEFFFESMELYKLEEEFKRQLLADEIEKFEDFGCAILKK
jgi:hypothetical protein